MTSPSPEESERKVERVARAICHAAGEHPDTMLEGLSMVAGHLHHFDPARPTWTAFQGEARRWLAAYEALSEPHP